MLKHCLAVLAAMVMAGTLQAKDLKVLMIGNSFSICVGKNLPQIVASVPGHTLELTSCYIGGCVLQRHCKEWQTAEKNPKHKPYKISIWNSAGGKSRVFRSNVNEILKNNKYDIVSIQQGSSHSWDWGKYEPYAAELIGYIKKYQPQAEIVIQQTWSYRYDTRRMKNWNLDQQSMYDKLSAAYKNLAEKYQFRVIPVGDAVQLFRSRTPVKFVKADLAKYKKPEVPPHPGEVVGKYAWRKNDKTQKDFLWTDFTHLNNDGEYMQALVWFAVLYNEPLDKVKFIPEKLTAPAELLRSCAADAVKNYKQVK